MDRQSTTVSWQCSASKVQSRSLSGSRSCKLAFQAFHSAHQPTNTYRVPMYPVSTSPRPPSLHNFTFIFLWSRLGCFLVTGTVPPPRIANRRSTFFWISSETSPGNSTRWITTPPDTQRTWSTSQTSSCVSVSTPFLHNPCHPLSPTRQAASFLIAV